jgi:hypothetical protein
MKHLIFLFLAFSLALFSVAQDKADVIIKANGEEVKCKVVEVTPTEVKFTYPGETAVYVLGKSEIARIIFSSGRTEVFGDVQQPSMQTALANNRNKVAILPISYIMNGQRAVHEMSEKVQLETYNYLLRNAAAYQVQDPRTTNALLIKSGVTVDNIKGYTPDEICRMLGVEYTIEGVVTVDPKSQTSYQSSNYNQKNSSGSKPGSGNSSSYSGSTTSTTSQNYQTSLMLSVFNDRGNTVFSQTKTSFWSGKDSYKSTLDYLLKRTPFYGK